VPAVVLSLLTAPAAGAATGRTQIQMQDRCEPVSFNEFGNQPGGPGDICFKNGDVTFAEFLDKLNPDDGGHGAWRFSREKTHIDAGQSLSVRNTGGEVHCFTEVVDFGTGIVPELNAAVTETAPAVPVGDEGPIFVGPGGVLEVSGLTPGTHKFECLIHPWMRSTVEVRR
jgi:hypothetical protein